MPNQKHNGWTNYATWRIKLELFSDVCNQFEDRDADITPEEVKELAHDYITNFDALEGVAVDYAIAFVSDVNWHEIAESINNELRANREYSIERDHTSIKRQIKKWEWQIDRLREDYANSKEIDELLENLENISHEMMSINM